MGAIDIGLKAKYRIPGRMLHRLGIDPPYGTMVYIVGISSKRGKKGGNSGGVGRVARRARRWPPGLKQRRRAIL